MFLRCWSPGLFLWIFINISGQLMILHKKVFWVLIDFEGGMVTGGIGRGKKVGVEKEGV